MIDVIIASYNEPKSALRAVNQILKQKYPDIRVTVMDPFPEVGVFLKKHIKSKSFHFFLDPGEGKSYALNLLFQEYASTNTDDLFVLTDGDVYVSDNALNEITSAFKDPKVGAITGRPVPLDSRSNKYGYWAHLFFSGIDRVRRKLSAENKFMECSGYLFAIRKGIILDFPMETSEDSIIPYLIWKKGYSIKYVLKAEVYVKNPSNFKDWLNQKVRNIKAHENLSKIAPDMPRTKSLFNEIKFGLFFAIKYPKTFLELWWTFQAYFARLYLYIKAFQELRKKSSYKDGWRETEISSTRTLD